MAIEVRNIIDLGLGIVKAPDKPFGIENRYTPQNGIPGLVSAVAEHHCTPLDTICITSGASMGLVSSLAALRVPGEILCPRPYYPAYPEMIRATGHRIVFYDLQPETRWRPNANQIRRLISEKTRAILINNPANPTGALLNECMLGEIFAIIRTSSIVAIVDESACEFVYGDVDFPDARRAFPSQRLVQIRSFSKAFALPSLRLGYVISAPEWIAEISRMHWVMTLGASSGNQKYLKGILINEGWGRCAKICAELREKRNLALRKLGEHAAAPEAGVFIWVKTPETNSIGFCNLLKQDYGIIAMPGEAFGTAGYARICLGPDVETVEFGVRGILLAISRMIRKHCPETLTSG